MCSLVYQILSREVVKEVKTKNQTDDLVDFLDQYDIGRQLAHALQV